MAGEHSVIYFTPDTDLGDDDQNIDALLAGSQWDLSVSNVLDYSFLTLASQISYSLGAGVTFANGFNGAQQTAAEKALALYASVIDVTFNEIGDDLGEDPANGTLRFTDANGLPTAFGYYPNSAESGGDMAFLDGSYETMDMGTYEFLTLMHEMGHAMGLKHGHDGSGSGALTADKDGMEYSVMTYNSFVGQNTAPNFYTNASGHYAQTLMMYDIAALQRMYGANWTENDTASTYTFDTTTGEMSVNGTGQGAATADVTFRTVWDGGGKDTFDLSNFITDLMIDLSPGGYSDFDVGGNALRAQLNAGWNAAGTFVGEAAYEYASGHIYNALQYGDSLLSLIEHATGGSGDDNITGNIVKNILAGNSGKDKLYGLGGNDILRGGAKGDVLKGGAGDDTLHGGYGKDRLFGGKGNDYLSGNGGADKFLFNTGDGRDTILDFDDGRDLIKIQSGAASFADLTVAQDGADTLVTFSNVRLTLVDIAAADITSDDFLF